MDRAESAKQRHRQSVRWVVVLGLLCVGAAKSSQLMVRQPKAKTMVPVTLSIITNKPPTNCVTLTWDAYPGATNYTVQIGTNAPISVGNITWCSLCGLAGSDTLFSVLVQPYDYVGLGQTPPSVTRTSALQVVIPPPSTNIITVTAIVATNGTIGGKWVDLVKYQPISFTNPAGNLFFLPRGQIDVQTIQQPSKTVLLP